MHSVIGKVIGLSLLGAIATGLGQAALAQSLVIVSSTQGNVTLRRGSGSFQPISPGQRLQANDVIQVRSGGAVALLCPNRTTRRIHSAMTFSVAQQCPTASTVASRSNGLLRSPSAAEDATLPYLLNPMTFQGIGVVASLTPTFRWHGVEGVTDYQVYVHQRGQRQTAEPVTVTGTSWTYDGAKPLQYGKQYRITVVAAGTGCDRLSSTNPCGAQFQTLTQGEVEAVHGAIADLQTSQFNDAIKALAIADVYRQNQLYGDAIAQLEAAIAAGHSMISTHQILAELYDEVGYYDAAQGHYIHAHHQSQAENDLIAQATLEQTLGALNVFLDQVPEAMTWLQRAKTTYQTFNDQETVATIEAELDRLAAMDPANPSIAPSFPSE